MKKIPLTQGKFAIVDDEDFESLNQWKWYACKKNHTYYAARRGYVDNGKLVVISMHRQILGLHYKDKKLSDHKNHFGLDNRKRNLRICSSEQNCRNRKPYKNKSSKYKGVAWNKRKKKWESAIKKNGLHIYLGCFVKEKDAALAYDKKAIDIFGEFACTNFL